MNTGKTLLSRRPTHGPCASISAFSFHHFNFSPPPLARVKALAPQHPEYKNKQPFASLLKGDVKGALAGGEHTMLEIVMAGHAVRVLTTPPPNLARMNGETTVCSSPPFLP
jgi:hypothetical protein